MTQFTSGTGRLVWGHPLVKKAKTGNDGKPVIGKDGQPVMVHAFGVAFPKAATLPAERQHESFEATLWPIMQGEAMLACSNNIPGHFAWKYKDGDTNTGHRQGKPYNEREGYPGHYVLNFETQIDVIGYIRDPQTGAWNQCTDRDMKTGDFIVVSGDISGNKPDNPSHTPSLFINPRGVLLIGLGQAIMNAPTADQMFGGRQFSMPPGALPPGSMPAAPAGAPMPMGMPPVPGQPPTAPAAPQYQQPAPMAPQPQYAPPAAPVYAAPVAPVAPQPQYQQPAVPGAPVYPPVPGFVQQAAGVPAAPQPGPGGVPLPPGSMPPQQ
jgi:hypothetical protein